MVYDFNAGGLERCVAHLCNHLDRDLFEPLVVCLSRNGSAWPWVLRDDVEVIELFKPPRKDLLIFPRLATALRQARVDVAHSHNWETLLETAFACHAGPRIAHLHAEHGQELSDIKLNQTRHKLRSHGRQLTFRRLDALVACARSVQKRIISDWKIERSRVEFVPNGVEKPPGSQNQEALALLRRKLEIPPDARIFGSVGRLAPIKNFAAAIAALDALVHQHRHDAHLVLVGDGPLREELRCEARERRLSSRVHLVGYQHNVGDWLRLFDVYINSSLGEAMNMAILEAMAWARPVVATEVGDVRQQIGGHGSCGLLVPPNDPDAMARTLADLLGDEAAQRRLGEHGQRRYMDQYTVQHMVERYAALYKRICGA